MDEVTHKKPVALDCFMDKVRYASWSGMPAVAMALYETLRSEYGYFQIRPRARISVGHSAQVVSRIADGSSRAAMENVFASSI